MTLSVIVVCECTAFVQEPTCRGWNPSSSVEDSRRSTPTSLSSHVRIVVVATRKAGAGRCLRIRWQVVASSGEDEHLAVRVPPHAVHIALASAGPPSKRSSPVHGIGPSAPMVRASWPMIFLASSGS